MLLRQVLSLAALYEWRAFHMTNATRLIKQRIGYIRASNINPQGVGFPDVVLVSAKRSRLIFAELKRDLGPRGGSSDHQKPTTEQQAWINDLRMVRGVEAYVWRPSDLEVIAKTLSV